MDITQEIVKSLFDYHEDGYLTWKIRPWKYISPGTKVGHLEKYNGGHRQRLSIKHKRYFAASIIFLYFKGYIPEKVDHKDRNTLNDKIDNLRAANGFQNARNKTSARGSSSKYLGVTLRKNGTWGAHITIDRKLKHLGYFKVEKEAAIAFNKAAETHYGEFANLNIV